MSAPAPAHTRTAARGVAATPAAAPPPSTPVQEQLFATTTHRNARPRCAECGRPGPTIDRMCTAHADSIHIVSPEQLHEAGLL